MMPYTAWKFWISNFMEVLKKKDTSTSRSQSWSLQSGLPLHGWLATAECNVEYISMLCNCLLNTVLPRYTSLIQSFTRYLCSKIVLCTHPIPWNAMFSGTWKKEKSFIPLWGWPWLWRHVKRVKQASSPRWSFVERKRKWSPRNLSFQSQFTPKMKAKAISRLLSSLVWIDSGVVASLHCLASVSSSPP